MGSGSGLRFDAKDTTSDYRAIDVRRWKRDGLLKSGQSFSWQWTRNNKVFASIQAYTEPHKIILTYRHRKPGDDWVDESYPIYLNWTECNYGGERPWFLCPVLGCGRRVAILYGSSIFACRHCHQLAYDSQRETFSDRSVRKADEIRDRLGWVPGILNGTGTKPKGMHWKTYHRIVYEYYNLVGISLENMKKQITYLHNRL